MVRSFNLAMASAALIVLACWVSELVDAYQNASLAAYIRPDPEIQEMWRQRRAFAPVYEKVCIQAAQGQVSLQEASRRVHREATELFPRYLKSVDTLHFDGNLDTKIAGSILFLLRKQPPLEWVKIAPERLAHLQREYEEMRRGAGPNDPRDSKTRPAAWRFC